jgi:hypothetical protein
VALFTGRNTFLPQNEKKQFQKISSKTSGAIGQHESSLGWHGSSQKTKILGPL